MFLAVRPTDWPDSAPRIASRTGQSQSQSGEKHESGANLGRGKEGTEHGHFSYCYLPGADPCTRERYPRQRCAPIRYYRDISASVSPRNIRETPDISKQSGCWLGGP